MVHGAQFALYVVASWLLWRAKTFDRRELWVILAFALVLRAVLVAQTPFLSSDVYRNVWDGRVQAWGINPYRFVPCA